MDHFCCLRGFVPKQWVKEAKSSIKRSLATKNPSRITARVCVYKATYDMSQTTCHTLDFNMEISFFLYLLHNDAYQTISNINTINLQYDFVYM